MATFYVQFFDKRLEPVGGFVLFPNEYAEAPEYALAKTPTFLGFTIYPDKKTLYVLNSLTALNLRDQWSLCSGGGAVKAMDETEGSIAADVDRLHI